MYKYSDKPKEFYFETDNNFGRKSIIWSNNEVSVEIGYHYEGGNVESYDGKIIDNVTHPFKAAKNPQGILDCDN